MSAAPGLFERTDPAACGLPEWELEFWVAGRPQTAGSKTFLRAPGQKGRVMESGDRVAKRAWRTDLRSAAEDAIFQTYAPTLWPCAKGAPLEVEFTFIRARAKSHYGTGKNAAVLKESAPAYPTARPDALKLARAAEDALTGVVWADDSQIVRELLVKVFGDREGCRVRVRRLG